MPPPIAHVALALPSTPRSPIAEHALAPSPSVAPIDSSTRSAKSGDPPPNNHDVAVALAQIATSLQSAMATSLTQWGLTYLEWRVLKFIAQNNKVFTSDIAKAMARPAISSVAHRLGQNGWVTAVRTERYPGRQLQETWMITAKARTVVPLPTDFATSLERYIFECGLSLSEAQVTKLHQMSLDIDTSALRSPNLNSVMA
jgi:DNA-binding MarR family transcriptional regulator